MQDGAYCLSPKRKRRLRRSPSLALRAQMPGRSLIRFYDAARSHCYVESFNPTADSPRDALPFGRRHRRPGAGQPARRRGGRRSRAGRASPPRPSASSTSSPTAVRRRSIHSTPSRSCSGSTASPSRANSFPGPAMPRRAAARRLPPRTNSAGAARAASRSASCCPHIGGVIDDICVVRSMHADDISHDGGIMFMNTGAARLSRPSLGSWVTYGLGSENRNLPGFIAMCPDGYPLNETQNWQSAFLPGVYQGTFVNSRHEEVDRLIENIRNARVSPDRTAGPARSAGPAQPDPSASSVPTRAGWSRASRVSSRPSACKWRRPTPSTCRANRRACWSMYGPGQQGAAAHPGPAPARTRRAHGASVVRGRVPLGSSRRNRRSGCPPPCGDVDRPIAAFLTDLKQRGMLDDTLVLWGGEFGRTPTVELPHPTTTPGRDHNRHGFTVWLAGGGVKGGHVHGATDEAGFAAVRRQGARPRSARHHPASARPRP